MEIPAYLLAVIVLCSTNFDNSKAQVMIQEPPEAKLYANNTVIEGATATFGSPYYGEILEGELLFFESYGCTADSYSLPSNNDESNVMGGSKSTPQIIMLRRGECSFAHKVRIAEEKGAKAVIVADAINSLLTREDIVKVIIAEESTTAVKIPSILLCKEDADILINAAYGSSVERISRINGRGPNTVILQLTWTLPKDHAVQVDIWLTPSSTASVKFLQNFEHFAKIFKNRIDFQPHYWLMSLSHNYHAMCTDEKADFCAFDPDFAGNVTGKDILEESVRQLCLWECTRSLDPRQPHGGFYSRVWWDYVKLLPSECPYDGNTEERRFGSVCSLKLMQSLDVHIRQIEKCYKNSFTTHLAHQLVNRAWSPSAIIINKMRYNGPLDAELVAKAICTAFIKNEKRCQEAVRYGIYDPDDNLHSDGFCGMGFALAAFVVVVAATAAFAYILTKYYIPKDRAQQTVAMNSRRQSAQEGKAGDVDGRPIYCE